MNKIELNKYESPEDKTRQNKSDRQECRRKQKNKTRQEKNEWRAEGETKAKKLNFKKHRELMIRSDRDTDIVKYREK